MRETDWCFDLSLTASLHDYREVVERRVYTVTGQRPGEEEVEQLIETGESETIFQKAILERGRGQVPGPPCMLHTPGPLRKCSDGRPSEDGAAHTGS